MDAEMEIESHIIPARPMRMAAMVVPSLPLSPRHPTSLRRCTG